MIQMVLAFHASRYNIDKIYIIIFRYLYGYLTGMWYILLINNLMNNKNKKINIYYSHKNIMNIYWLLLRDKIWYYNLMNNILKLIKYANSQLSTRIWKFNNFIMMKKFAYYYIIFQLLLLCVALAHTLLQQGIERSKKKNQEFFILIFYIFFFICVCYSFLFFVIFCVFWVFMCDVWCVIQGSSGSI